jgi:Cys-tRNA(Pro)/Cys-tRNA(Cys) deacylase
MSGRSTPATVAAVNAGLVFTVHEYAHDPVSVSYGLEAATALGVEAMRVFKTLVATVEVNGREELVVGLVPVDRQLDLKALGSALGVKRASMAEVGAAERATGYVAGGISPIGQRKAHRTVVDESVELHDTVFVSAGRRGLEIELAPSDLLVLTAAVVAPLAAM